MVGAYMLIAVFGNVGNFGLPIIKFAYGERALVEATVYFLAILTISFVVGVGAANWHKGSRFTAAIAVFKTPAILALPPALLLNWQGWALPAFLGRGIELLADALIPTMLIALGVQLASVGLPRLNSDMILASAIKLVGGAVLALILAIPFGLTGLERNIGVLQASMPTAVLASMIAVEHDLVPQFVITTVLVCTLASVVTLTVVLAILGV
jgi:predicted permease